MYFAEERFNVHTKKPFSFILHCFIPFINITVGELLFLILFAGILGLTFGLSYSETKYKYRDLIPNDTKRFGLRGLGDCQLLMLAFMFFANTRNSLALFIFGIPFERAVTYHRWVGRLLVMSVICHATIAFDRFKVKGIFEFKQDYAGFIAGVGLGVLFLFTFEPIRRRFWEVFYFTHLLYIWVAAWALTHIFLFNLTSAHFNSWITPSVLLFAILLYYFDRGLRIYKGQFQPTQLISAKPGFEITRLELKKKNGFKYEGGQYIWLNLPEVSLVQWHPFSISSGPKEDNFTVHIKDCGNFTHEVFDKATEGKITKAKVDGPYGRLSIGLKEYNVIVLFAGGIGVTPMMAVLKELDNLSQRKTKIYFIWVVQNGSAFDWFSDSLNEMQNKSDIVLKLYVSRGEKEANETGLKFTKGRPIFTEIVEEVISQNENESFIGVLACGPKSMVSTVFDVCMKSNCNSKTTKKHAKLHFHKETFRL